MPAQIRPTRLDVTDRFPMLAFKITADDDASQAEVAIATDPALFAADAKAKRTCSNFYSTHGSGRVPITGRQGSYAVPPEVLARMIGNPKLYFGLATKDKSGAMKVAFVPGPDSPYVSIRQLSARSMSRVRLLPSRQQIAGGYGKDQGGLDWAGDIATPGAQPVAGGTSGTDKPNGAAQHAAYDDGFGPMPGAKAPAAPSPAPAPGGATAAAAAKGLSVALDDERIPVTPPTVSVAGTVASLAIDAALALAVGPLGPFISTLKAAANALGCSVGLGPQVGAGLGAGGALGAGIIFGKDGDYGIYGGGEIDIGFITSISATAVVTIVKGGIEAFNGWSGAFAVNGGEGIVGGAAALFTAAGDFVGVSANVGIGAGFSPVDFYIAIQRTWATKVMSLALDAPTSRARPLQARAPAQAGGTARGARTGKPARALDADTATLDVVYRMFIPSPLIQAPTAIFGGDGRDFGISGGTSRGELRARVNLTPGGGIAGFANVDRHWGESTEYASSDAHHVDGKPDWWWDKNDGAQPIDRKTLAVLDDNFAIAAGSSGTTRNIQAMAENASIFSITASGSLPLSAVAPAIDSDLSILVRQGSAGLECKVVGEHDGFPCHELYINGQPVYRYDPVAAGSSPTALLPPMDVSVDTGWTVCATPSAQSLGAGRMLVFKDRPASEQWRTGHDFEPITLTTIAWDDAPDTPVAFVYFGHVNVDFDGSPTAYKPDDTGDDNLANAIDSGRNKWVGVVAMQPSDPLVQNGTVIIDQRPERDHGGFFPVIQQAQNGDPNPGYYVSQTSRTADASLPVYMQRRYLDASSIPYGALSGKLASLGVALGDFGLVIRHDKNLQSGFYFADAGGNTYALGESSQKVGTNLGGSGRGNGFNNNFPVSFIVFPGTAVQGPNDPPLSEAQINAQVTAALAQLSQAANADDLALLLGFNEVPPVDRDHKDRYRAPPGKAGLDAYRAKPGALPRNYANVVGGLQNFGFTPSTGLDQGQAYSSRTLADTDIFTINWDEVQSVAQPTDVSCWATSAAMVIGWRDNMSMSIDAIAAVGGRSTATGLQPSQVGQFAADMGLTAEPPQSYTIDGFRRLLLNNGPLWVGAAVPGLHAIVVTGLYSDGTNCFVRITDPWDRTVGSPGSPGAYAKTHLTGSRYIMKWEDFVAEYERAATDFSAVNLQILHCGGTFGHSPNTGEGGTPAGYAMAADVAPATGTTAAPRQIGGAPITTTSGSQGNVRWTLDQFKGPKFPGNVAPATGKGFSDAPTIRLDRWPVLGDLAQTGAVFAIDWLFDGQAIGDVRVTNSGVTTGEASLDVLGEIIDDPNVYPPTGCAALKLRLTYRFQHQQGGTEAEAVTDVHLFGDGTHEINSQWIRQTSNGALPAAQSRAMEGGPAEKAAEIIVGKLTEKDSVSWQFDSFTGPKHPNDTPPANPGPYQDGPTIKIRGWTKGLISDCGLDCDIAWQYNGQSVGPITVKNVDPDDGVAWRLNVRGVISHDNIVYDHRAPTIVITDGGPAPLMIDEDNAAPGDMSRKPCAAMRIDIQFDFQEWPVGPRHVGVSQVIVYGDGTFVHKDHWIKDPLF